MCVYRLRVSLPWLSFFFFLFYVLVSAQVTTEEKKSEREWRSERGDQTEITVLGEFRFPKKVFDFADHCCCEFGFQSSIKIMRFWVNLGFVSTKILVSINIRRGLETVIQVQKGTFLEKKNWMLLNSDITPLCSTPWQYRSFPVQDI